MSGTTQAADLDNQELLAALEAAAARFRSNLHGSRGTAAREYLGARGLTRNTIERIGAGLAIDSWNDLFQALRPRFGEQVLVNAGLVIQKPERRWTYDRFRNRVVFPICDEQGRVLAFGGRALEAPQPKYINSPDTAVYQKGSSLYGLQWAARAARASGRMVVVEGSLDAAAVLQCGIEEVVASCGAALNPTRAAILRSLAQRVLLCFDPDDAGRSATRRSIDLLLGHEVHASIVDMPSGHDPASLVIEDRKAFVTRVDGAVPGMEWLIRAEAGRCDTTSPGGKGAFIRALIPVFLRIDNPADRRAWLGFAASFGRVDPIAAEEELEQAEGQARTTKRVAGASDAPKTSGFPERT